MTYSDLEIKFIRHALDTNSEGEAGNAAAMFFKELRKRGIKAHQFLEANVAGSSSSASNLDYKLKYERVLEEIAKVKKLWHDEINAGAWLRKYSENQGAELVVERGARLRAEQALALAQKELAIVQAKKVQKPATRIDNWFYGYEFEKNNQSHRNFQSDGKSQRPWWKGGLYDKMNEW